MEQSRQSPLSEALHQVVAVAPPTGIELDGLIAGHRRAARRRRWLSMAAGVSVLGAAVLGVSLSGYRGPAPLAQVGDPGQTAQSKPAETAPVLPGRTPTEPASVAISRLDQALKDAVRAQFVSRPSNQIPTTEPDLGLTDPTVDAGAIFSGAPESGYKALVTFADTAGSSDLQVLILSASMPADTPCVKTDLTVTCTRQTMADGTTILRRVSADNGATVYSVEVYRPDGTQVWLVETHWRWPDLDPQAKRLTPSAPVLTRPAPLLDLDVLVHIATSASLTLFP